MKISNWKSKLSTLALSASVLMATTGSAKAQGFSTGNINTLTLANPGGGINQLIGNIVNIALYFIGIIAVIYLIWGGVTYITAGGDAEKAGKGRIAITNAIIGIIIVVASLVIYNAVIKIPATSNGGSL